MKSYNILKKPYFQTHHKSRAVAETLLQTYTEWRKDGTLRIGAGIAYYGIIALVPMLIIAYGIAELFFSSYEILSFIQEFINGLFGEQAPNIGNELLGDAKSTESVTLVSGLVGIGSLMFAATLIFVAVQDALNIIWKTQKGHNFSPMRYVISFGIMLFTGATMTVVLAGHAIINFTNNLLPEKIVLFSVFTGIAGVLLVYTISSITILLLLKSFIKIKLSWRDLLLSSMTIAGFIYVGVYGLAIYLSNFADKSMYGSLSGLILSLVAIYYFAQIFLAGAQLSKVIAYRNGNKYLQKYLKETDPRLL